MNFEVERKRLVDQLKLYGYIRTREVERAFLKVPREEFVPPDLRKKAYLDTPLPIGHGQTISAPHMVAIMTELLGARIGEKVLEVGTGSGYQAAILAEIVNPDRKAGGIVYTIERIPQLAEFAKKNLERTSYINRVVVIVGDGSKGYPKEAPYDKIIVTAAAPRVPRSLLEQMRSPGRMVIPVGTRYEQTLLVVEKDLEGKIRITESIPCVFVPLIGEEGWKD
ncbi:MAG: protein-L-isoaspartate(D-aspartate) O-methyltransferase [Desulfurococcales archaeon]|nr:protein-L-isoaspartate(D-aspartate) O-methyltransferase [Desulfurococcales archaeon]